MDMQTDTTRIARRVRSAIAERGADVSFVADAADITTRQLEDRLSGRVEFQLDELVGVGGFLRIPTRHFMEALA